MTIQDDWEAAFPQYVVPGVASSGLAPAPKAKVFAFGAKLFGLTSATVNLSGDQPIAGRKTFATPPTIPNGVLATDSANIGQLNAAISVGAKAPLTAVDAFADAGSVSLSAPGAAIDGVTMSSGMTFLFAKPDGTSGASHGKYVWNGASSPATRSTDADSGAELALCNVAVKTPPSGTNTYGGTRWGCQQVAITLGTTGISFSIIFDGRGMAAEAARAATAEAALAAQSSVMATLGRPHASMPVTGTASADRIYVMRDRASRDGTGVLVRGYGASSGTLYINTWDDTGTLTKSQEVSITTPAGAYEIVVSIAVLKGQAVGFRGANCFTYTSNAPDGAGWQQNGTNGDATSFVPQPSTAGIRLEVGIDIQTVLFNVVGQVDDLDAQLNQTQVIGRAASTPPVTGGGVSDYIFVMKDEIETNSVIARLRGYAFSGGSLDVHAWAKSGSTYTKTASITVTVPTGEYDFPIVLSGVAGQYVGFRGANCVTYTSDPVDGAGWDTNSVTGDASSFTAVAGSAHQLQVGFDVVTDISAILAGFGSLLQGKTWLHKNVAFAGDSMTAHNYFQGPTMSILQANWLSFTGDAISGRKMADLVSYLTSMALSSVDLLLIGLGTNDFGFNRTLGAYGDATGANTFYGDTRNVIETALTAKPSLRIGFWTPPKRGINSGQPAWSTANGVGHVLGDYVTAVKLVAADYGVPVLDMFTQSGINDFNYTTTTEDNLHPTLAYSAARLAPMLAKFAEAI